jgi:hypothetical protein
VETIPQTDAASAPSKTQDLLYAVKKQMGGLPKFLPPWRNHRPGAVVVLELPGHSPQEACQM